MKLFKRKAKKQLNLSTINELVWNNLLGLNYTKQAVNYNNVDYLIAKSIVRPINDAINKIADNTLVIEPRLWDKLKLEYINKSPMLDLLNNPNPFFNYSVFIKMLVSSYLTFGNAYYIIGFIGNKPVSLLNIDTTSVAIEVNNSDGLASIYRVNQFNNNVEFKRDMLNGKIIYRDDSDRILVHIREASISSQWMLKGDSKINAIMGDVNLYNAVYLYNQSILDNQGRPSGMFKMQENIVLNDEQLDHLNEQWKSLYGGSNNAGKMLVSPPGLDYQQLSLSPKDIEYGQILDVVTKGVYNTFNIPLSLIQSTALSLANMQIAMSHFYLNAVLPTIKTMFDSFTSNVLLYFIDDWQNNVITYDERTIPALRGIQLENLKQEAALNVLTINEMRAALNREPINNGKDVYIPSDLQPIGDIADSDNFIEKDDDGNDTA